MGKVKVGYVCVHNSCRSQMAEAITKKYYGDFFEAYSGGTETKPEINQDAVRTIKKHHGIDMNETQYSKLIDELPSELDVLITMGCAVACPFIPTKHREDWGLEDPTGQSEEAFEDTMHLIEDKIKHLKKRIENNEINLE